MEFSTNQGLQVGMIISTLANQIAIASPHRYFPAGLKTWKDSEYPCIKISGDCNPVINTNYWYDGGIVCFIPKQFNNQAIIKIKITEVKNKSVYAEVLDWIDLRGKYFTTGDNVNEVRAKLNCNANLQEQS